MVEIEDYWAEDTDYPVEDWRHEVAEDNTRQGYWEWVKSQKEVNEDSYLPVDQRIAELAEKYDFFNEFWRGYTQALGFTGSLVSEPDASCEEPLFHCPGQDINDVFDVWQEVSPVIAQKDASELLDDCAGFLEQCAAKNLLDVVEINPEMAGSDFHHTRNGHGCGFWDGDWDDIPGHQSAGDELSAIAKTFGTCELWGRRDEDSELSSVELMH